MNIPAQLLEQIRSFETSREVEHCGAHFDVSPFDIYATCPRCAAQIKVRAMSGEVELEDVFDAVFAWMDCEGADEAVTRRRLQIRDDRA